MRADEPARVAADDSLEECFPGLDVLERAPPNVERADRTVGGLLTPRENHYVRSHYETPEIDAGSWTISLSGSVAVTGISVEDLRTSYPSESVAHTMECSGNGRSGFEPDADGHQWTHGSVGTTIRTGAPVSAVLEDHDADADRGGWISVGGGDAPEGST